MDAPLGGAVREIGEQDQGLAQGDRALLGRAVDQTKMIEAQHVDEPPRDFAGRGGLGLARHRRHRRLAWPGRAGDAAHLQRDVVGEAEIRAALADGQAVGQMPVGAERAQTQFRDALRVVGIAALAERKEHLGAGVVGLAAEFRLMRGAPSRQAAHGVAEPGAAVAGGGGIERRDRRFVRRACDMGEDVEDAMDFVVHGAAAVGDDVIFVSVADDRHAVEPLLEQIDRRRRIEGKHVRPHRRRQPGIALVEGEDDVEGLAVEPGHDLFEPGEIEAEEAARERKIFAQDVEAAKQPDIVGNQRLVLVEADLAHDVGRGPDPDGIAEGIEVAEIDAAEPREHLLVKRDGVALGAEQMEAQGFGAAAAGEELGLLGDILVLRLVLAARRRAHGELQPQARRRLNPARRQKRLQRRGAGDVFGLDEIERP